MDCKIYSGRKMDQLGLAGCRMGRENRKEAFIFHYEHWHFPTCFLCIIVLCFSGPQGQTKDSGRSVNGYHETFLFLNSTPESRKILTFPPYTYTNLVLSNRPCRPFGENKQVTCTFSLVGQKTVLGTVWENGGCKVNSLMLCSPSESRVPELLFNNKGCLGNLFIDLLSHNAWLSMR